MGAYADTPPRTDHDHVVEFYELDSALIGTVCEFFARGLAAGEGAVVVATPEHRREIDGALLQAGIDLVTADKEGRYISLDASTLLSAFVVDGEPQATTFVEMFGSLIDRVAAGRRDVRVFGEMVALLCGEGNFPGAIRLEELWNELGSTRPFTLFCAYPLRDFDDPALAAAFHDVCATHSHVAPNVSYSKLRSKHAR